MPIIKIAIYATEVACAVLVEVKAGITIRTAREELNVQIAAKRENAEHATEQARFLDQLNGIEFVKVLQNKIGRAITPPVFIYGGAFGNAADEGLFGALLECSGKIVILQGQNQSRKVAMTIEDIRKLVSGDETREIELKKTTGELKDAMHPYNPLIADVLYKTSYLESWGSGVKRIIEACRKQNVPDPEWSLRGGFVIVTFRRSTLTNGKKDDQKTGKVSQKDDKEVIEKVAENTEKVIEKVIEKAAILGERLTENKIKLLQLVIENPQISKLEISKTIGISPNSVSRNIEAMRDKYIRRVGPDKGGFWEVII